MVYQSEGIRLKATFRNFVLAEVDPTTITLEVVDSAGTVVDTFTKGDMENPSTGVYYYDYTLDAAAPVGVWTQKWRGVIAGLPKPGKSTFSVVAF